MSGEGPFQRYLRAKRTVDDRAINTRVEKRLAAALDDHESRDPLRVLDVGAGIGGALERLLAREVLPERVAYTLLDDCETNVEIARERLPNTTAGWDLRVADGKPETGYESWLGDGRCVRIELITSDAFSFVERTERRWDLIIAQSFLDLFDAQSAAERLLSVLSPDGLCYFPLTFDGGTHFAPTVEALDGHVERLYHERIDDGGDSRAGQHLLAGLPATGVDVLAAGGSDWVVIPRAGSYPNDEKAFLGAILDMVEGALADHPALDGDAFDKWLTARRTQLDAGKLVYVAHQLDVLGRVPGPESEGGRSPSEP